MSKKTLIFFFGYLLFFSCNNDSLLTEKEEQFLETNKNIVVAVYLSEFPPFNYVNEDGIIDGIPLDHFNLLEKKINHTFKKKYYKKWDELIEDSKKNKVDIVLEIQNTNQRRKYLSFTKPVFKDEHIIITNSENKNITLESLKGKKVAVGKNYSVEEYLKTNHPEIILMPVLNEEYGINYLINNQVDALIGLRSTINYVIKKTKSNNLIIQKPIPYPNELSIAINKTKPILVNIINKANEAVSLKEKNDILSMRFYNIIKPIYKKEIFWEILLSIAVFISLILLIFNKILNNKIKSRTKDLLKAKELADKNSELKTMFLQNISHEIRTPLNSFQGLTNFIKNENLENIENKEFLNTITEQSNKLTRVLNNIIEVSELSNIVKELRYDEFCILKELTILVNIYSSKAELKKLKFNFFNSIDKKDSIIISDKFKLTKAINNVLDNALKFTNEGEINLHSKIENEKICIKISDTGIGIKPEQSKDIFLGFYQIEKDISKKNDGLGIGLTLANECIKALSGELLFISNYNKGTSFEIKIPHLPSKLSTISNKPKVIHSKFKILIVDDVKLNYLVLQKMLEKLIDNDIKINWSENGQLALDYLKNNSCDLVFMDIKMPVLNGYDTTEKIKSLYPNIPVVSQTAFTHKGSYNRALSIGFDGYLTKPIKTSVLKTVIQQLFDLKLK